MAIITNTPPIISQPIVRTQNTTPVPVETTPNQEPVDKVELSQEQPTPGIYSFKNVNASYKRDAKVVVQNGNRTTTTTNGETTTEVNRVPNQTTRGGGVTLTDSTRRELSTEGQILGSNVKTTVYQESNTNVYGKGILTTQKGRNGNLDAGFGLSQEDKVGVRTDVELNKDVTVSNQNELSTKTEAKVQVNAISNEEKGQYESSTKIDALAAQEIKNTNTQSVNSKSLGVTFSNITENKASADAHVQAEDTLIAKEDKFLIKKDIDFSSEANAGTKNTWKMETTNGTSIETSSEGSVSEGLSFKGGVTLGRDNKEGTTEVGFKIGGPVPLAPFVGVGKEIKVKIADKDIDRVIDNTTPLLPQGAKDELKRVTKGTLSTIPKVASAAADKYVAVKKTVINNTPAVVKKTIRDARQTARTVVKKGVQTYNQGRQWVNGQYQAGKTYVKQQVSNVKQYATTTYNNAAEGATNLYNRASEGVTNTYNNVTQGAGNLYNGAKSYINSWWPGN